MPDGKEALLKQAPPHSSLVPSSAVTYRQLLSALRSFIRCRAAIAHELL
jgi:hypothetical protein